MKSYYIYFKFILFILLVEFLSFSVEAEDYSNLSINLSENRELKTGWLNDGNTVINGTVSINGSELHKGFSLAISGVTFIDARHFKLINANNPGEFISVKISGTEWVIDPDYNSRVLRFTSEKNSNFQLVSDGNQYIHAGKYNATINIATIN